MIYDDHDKIVVPRRMIKKLIEAAHAGHPGFETTWRKISGFYTWKGAKAEVATEVRKCTGCIIGQSSPAREKEMAPEIPNYQDELQVADVFDYEKENYLEFGQN